MVDTDVCTESEDVSVSSTLSDSTLDKAVLLSSTLLDSALDKDELESSMISEETSWSPNTIFIFSLIIAWIGHSSYIP